ncbi:ABC transporter permease [Antribacter sp. KLBMP9083]|uniref:ABC transporter permease n=1 Tax=Antribacter soli TaxID=2910976 RepID=A0AA41QHB2_9MICO|nr:ABC transporter permease [Antribacter soli]MCF4123475.1 ABC transporter permease [Antribacter soli]
MSGFLSGVVGAILEAWDELRIHKVRVLLALIGVAAAVTAITAVTAAVTMLQQAMQEQGERMAGRDTTLVASLWSSSPVPPPAAEIDAAVDSVTERYGITYYSVESWGSLSVRTGGGDQPIEQVQFVDPDYGTILRLDVDGGRWFTEADAQQFAPVLVVNQPFLDAFAGGATVAEHPTVLLGGDTPVTAAVIGTVPVQYPEEGPRALLLFDHALRWAPDSARAEMYRFWVPPANAADLGQVIERDLVAAGFTASVEPPFTDAFLLDSASRWIVLGVGGFALLLGGLGLLNIGLVTVRYRIREIGIRRSFGATGGRVFFGVLMESVVATFVAGVIGVVIAVAVVKNIPVEAVFGTALQDKPPFPLSAALVGMACAIAVGALAGLIPAIYAVRVKVIDAIRY